MSFWGFAAMIGVLRQEASKYLYKTFQLLFAKGHMSFWGFAAMIGVLRREASKYLYKPFQLLFTKGHMSLGTYVLLGFRCNDWGFDTGSLQIPLQTIPATFYKRTYVLRDICPSGVSLQ